MSFQTASTTFVQCVVKPGTYFVSAVAFVLTDSGTSPTNPAAFLATVGIVATPLTDFGGGATLVNQLLPTVSLFS